MALLLGLLLGTWVTVALLAGVWPVSALMAQGRWVQRPLTALLYALSLYGSYLWAVHFVRTALRQASLREGLSAAARWAYIRAAKSQGWRIPLARDSERLEARCRGMLHLWALRGLGRRMAEHRAAGITEAGEVKMLMSSAEPIAQGEADEEGHSEAVMPGTIEVSRRTATQSTATFYAYV